MNSVLEWLLGGGVGELSGQENWRLGFVADYNNYVRLALLLVVVAMVYMTVRSYRREGDAPRRIKIVSAGIRIAVILLGVMLLFRPAVIVTMTKTIYSSLVFLIDDSMSMSLADRYADAGRRRAMESFLGPGGRAVGLTSRRDMVLAALQRSGVASKLSRDHPLIFMKFSTAQPGRRAYTENLGAVDVAADADGWSAVVAGSLAGMLDRLSATGRETNIRKALRDALGRIEGRRVAGIVVISDGQATATATARPSSLGGTLAVAAKRGVGLYAVCVGDPTPPRNLAVVGLQAPGRVRRGARAEFTVTLAHRNLAAENVTVTLLRKRRGGGKWLDTGVSKTVVLEAEPAAPAGRRARGVQSVQLYHEPQELGQYVYRAEVAARADERNLDDNHADAVVRVTDEKINVLLVSGYASWEMQYVRDYLLRLPQEYRLSVWQQNSAEDIDQVASPGMKISKLPTKLGELLASPGYDVVILFDPQPTRGGFDGKFVELLKTFVKDHGKSLCYVAGNRYTDSTVRGGGPYKPLADMLPVVLAANMFNAVERIERRQVEPWRISLTPYGRDHPITRLAGSVGQTLDVWSILPGVFWTHPVARAKLTARVLAVNTNPLRRTVKNAPEPVIAVQSYGKGRVVYMGIDSTWRWRFVRDGFYHRRLWGNIVRYLATLGTRRITVNTGGDRFTSGEKITVEVEAYDREYKPVTDESFALEMIDTDSGKARKIVLAAVSNRPGLFRGTIVAAATGAFELRAGSGTATAAKRITIEPPRAEAARSEADPATMRTIASRPENFLWIDEIDKLARLVPSGRLEKKWEVPHELWDSRLAMLLIVMLLGCEWIIRKKHNMA